MVKDSMERFRVGGGWVQKGLTGPGACSVLPDSQVEPLV